MKHIKNFIKFFEMEDTNLHGIREYIQNFINGFAFDITGFKKLFDDNEIPVGYKYQGKVWRVLFFKDDNDFKKHLKNGFKTKKEVTSFTTDKKAISDIMKSLNNGLSYYAIFETVASDENCFLDINQICSDYDVENPYEYEEEVLLYSDKVDMNNVVEHGYINMIKESSDIELTRETYLNNGVYSSNKNDKIQEKTNFFDKIAVDKKYIKQIPHIDEIDKKLGCGANGCAYLLKDGKVLKITISESEYFICDDLLKIKTDITPYIYDIGKVETGKAPFGNDVFWILRDSVDMPNTEQNRIFDLFEKTHNEYYNVDSFINEHTDGFSEAFSNNEMDYDFLVHIQEICNKKDGEKVVELYYQIFDIVYLLANDYGIDFTDLHLGNFGYINNHLVLFDIM